MTKEVKKDQTSEPIIPTRESMRKAVVLDLDAAIYFLHALKENGDLVEELSDKLYERYTRSATIIDQVTKPKENGTN